MKKTEIITLSIALIAAVMSLYSIPGANILLVLSLSFAAVFYQYFSFALLHNLPLRVAFKKESYPKGSKPWIALSIITGIALCVGAVGSMFKLLHWPGANVLLLFSLIANLGVVVSSLVLANKEALPVVKNIQKRAAFALVISGGLFFFGSYLFLDFKYRAHPDYIQAVKAFQENPNNEELRSIMEDEKMKMIQQ